ncbi:hypothetical protein M3I53_23470 [Paraburkholderia sp. CNPSo 3272]|nr:hypothetical protein [Paraburkholderia sp. CNPSo 3272]MCP3726052.1 hypothetical protein [Paraburkholderia sp. CNPSo 3272]
MTGAGVDGDRERHHLDRSAAAAWLYAEATGFHVLDYVAHVTAFIASVP